MKDKTSYALGLSVANQFRGTGIRHIDIEDFTTAIRDVYDEKQPAISYEEAKEVVDTLFKSIANEESKFNLQAGEEFQRVLKEKSGVITLTSGLQYEILQEGNGPKPKETDSVVVHYHGTLINGTVFDSSKERGEPATFPVTAVIAGWTEILQLMPVGSTWRVVIPPKLAYGTRGAGNLIRSNATLIFTIELIKIEEKR